MMLALLMAEILFRDEDSELVSRILAGDKSEFETLVKKYEKLVYNAAYDCTHSQDAAFDVSQNTFLKVYNKLSSFRGESKFSTWIYRIAQNCAKDYLRAQKRHQTVSLTVTDEEENESSQLDIPETDINNLPYESAERAETVGIVRDAINSLSEEHREIITLRELDGYSYEEIAEILGLELGTVKSRLNRAKKSIKEYLENRNFF